METQVKNKEVVEPKALSKITLFRAFLSKLPGFCSYCGKKYVGCHSKNINIFFPVPQNGKCCPDGHEGYVDIFMGWGTVKNTFDFVENPPSEQTIK